MFSPPYLGTRRWSTYFIDRNLSGVLHSSFFCFVSASPSCGAGTSRRRRLRPPSPASPSCTPPPRGETRCSSRSRRGLRWMPPAGFTPCRPLVPLAVLLLLRGAAEGSHDRVVTKGTSRETRGGEGGRLRALVAAVSAAAAAAASPVAFTRALPRIRFRRSRRRLPDLCRPAGLPTAPIDAAWSLTPPLPR